MSCTRVSKIGIKQAEAVERLIKDRFKLSSCKFCDDDLANFMLPRNYMHGAYDVFCTVCGKWSGLELDSRVVSDFVEAIASTKHSAHKAVLTLLTGEPCRKDLLMNSGDERYTTFAKLLTNKEICHFSMELGSYSGLPESVHITNPYLRTEKDLKATLYAWEIMPLLSSALNQAVIKRLGEEPAFDYESQYLCKKCGAPPSEQTMQNFNQVLREGDIHCGRCGIYIRTWDPN